MGLSVRAFSSALLLEPHEVDQEGACADHVLAHVIDPRFHRSLQGLEDGRCYEVDWSSSVVVHSSYSGHNRFREALCALIAPVITPADVWKDPDSFADSLPFFELINFADNEGTIGPHAALSLLSDFETHLGDWRSVYGQNEYGSAQYREWLTALKVAAATGLLYFC